MGNRPKPPTVSNAELDRIERELEGLGSDISFAALQDKVESLYSGGKISLFAYYAEFLSFIAKAALTDPQWTHEFSEITRASRSSQPTVTIPVAMLGALVEGWTRYRMAEDNLSLGRAFGVEAKGKASGQGLRNDRDEFNKFEVDEYLAMQVIAMLSFHAQQGEFLSREQAFDRVAELFVGYQGPGRSIGRKRIAAAFAKHGPRIYGSLESVGVEMTPPNFDKSGGRNTRS